MCLTLSRVPGIASLLKTLLSLEVFPGLITYAFSYFEFLPHLGIHPALYYHMLALESFSNYFMVSVLGFSTRTSLAERNRDTFCIPQGS